MLTGIRDTNRLILLLLDPKEIWTLSQVNKEFSELCRGVWRDLVWRDFQINRPSGPYNEQYRYLSTAKLRDVLRDGRIDALELLHRTDPVCEYEAEGACGCGHLEMLKWIVERGVTPHSECIRYAIIEDHHEIFDYLWSLGVRPDPHSIQPGSMTMVEKLLALGYTPDEGWASGGLCSDNTEVLEFCYQRGIVPDLITIRVVCEFDCYDMMVWLCEHGVIPDQECANIAARSGHTRVVEYLEGRGIHPNQQNSC